MTYKILITKAALKDKEKIKGNKALESKVKNLIELISKNPYESPPSFEKLKGDLDGLISRRINIQHRLVYQVYEEEKVIKIISMWTHYENFMELKYERLKNNRGSKESFKKMGCRKQKNKRQEQSKKWM